jgi:Methyltransferase domain
MEANVKVAAEIVKFPDLLHVSGSIGYVEKLVIGQLLLITQPRLLVETGAMEGHTTRFLAEFMAMNELPGCRIASFDVPEVVDKILKNPYFNGHQSIQFVPGYLPESLRNFLEKSDRDVDFAIVDAMHNYPSVTQELKLIHSRLSPGGYVFCHDYREKDPKYQGVVYAVNNFVALYRYDMLPLNPSRLMDQEVVWGAALLRKPLARRSVLKRIYYLTRLAQIVELSGKALHSLGNGDQTSLR